MEEFYGQSWGAEEVGSYLSLLYPLCPPSRRAVRSLEIKGRSGKRRGGEEDFHDDDRRRADLHFSRRVYVTIPNLLVTPSFYGNAYDATPLQALSSSFCGIIYWRGVLATIIIVIGIIGIIYRCGSKHVLASWRSGVSLEHEGVVGGGCCWDGVIEGAVTDGLWGEERECIPF